MGIIDLIVHFTESLHCNYYSLISGTDPDCPRIRWMWPLGLEMNFFLENEFITTPSGFSANEMRKTKIHQDKHQSDNGEKLM